VAIEQTKVGEARMMEALDQHSYGEDAEITDVTLIVTVDYDTEAAARRSTKVHWTPNPGMAPRVGIGLLTQVRHALLLGKGVGRGSGKLG
jgi:hypothetical protein